MKSASYADMTDVLPRVLIVLLALTAGACAARGGGSAAVPRPFPGAVLPPGAGQTPAAEAAPPAQADTTDTASPAMPLTPGADIVTAVVRTALNYLGVPYRWGGTTPVGFDCSGFVQYIFAQHGRVLPREVQDQYGAGREIDLREVRPGDLLFFQTISRGASHVGVAVGDGRFVHAPSARGVVRVEPYTASYWTRRFVGARRVGDDITAPPRPGVFPGSIRSAR